MTAALVLRRPDVRELLLRRPELGASVVVVAAWVAVLALAAAGGHRHVSGGLPYWMLVTVAMIGPAALAGIRHTGLNSLRWRRRRAMVEFAAAYLALWIAFGALALAVAARVLVLVPRPVAFAIVLAGAAAWQLCPLKRRWLRDCHRSVPLPPRGWVAEKAALRFGLRNGAACLGSCWCLMLVMVVASGLVWTVLLAGFVTAEKLLQQPRRATRFGAAVLAIAAAGAALAALV
jgi:predicted metal-binding membrane protein